MPRAVQIVGLSGSLRRLSFNTALLHAAQEVLPPDTSLEIVELHDIPLFNQDIEREQGFPPAVQRLRDQIAAADALLFVTPEYNHSIPGVLKNAIDWVSRAGPNKEAPFNEKPAAMMGASPSMIGSARAQLHLHQIADTLNLRMVNKPEVLVMQAHQKFTDGRLTDDPTRTRVAELLQTLVEWTRRLRGE